MFAGAVGVVGGARSWRPMIRSSRRPQSLGRRELTATKRPGAEVVQTSSRCEDKVDERIATADAHGGSALAQLWHRIGRLDLHVDCADRRMPRQETRSRSTRRVRRPLRARGVAGGLRNP